MASKELSALASASTLDGTELVHVVQGGNSRKAVVSNIRVSPSLSGPAPSGWYILTGDKTSANLTVNADRLVLSPFVSARAFSAKPGIWSTYTSGTCRVAIYADNNGLPGDLLYYGPENLVSTASGFYFHTTNAEVPAGRVWIGAHCSVTTYFAGGGGTDNIVAASALPSAGGTYSRQSLVYTKSFAGGAPATLTGDVPTASISGVVFAFSL